MTPREVLDLIGNRLDGRVATEPEIVELRAALSAPEWLARLLRNYRLIGSRISIDEHVDESGLGVALLWLSPQQMISEAYEAEPGATVCPQGLLPIGACASGSGDPYFLDLRDHSSTDPALIRVRHDLAGRGEYPPEGLERVASSLSSFLSKAFVV
jgi:hypothetical protein